MFVLSQNKKIFMQVTQFQVQRNIGGKSGEKYALMGAAQVPGMYILGLYPTAEDAMEEIQRIMAAMNEGQTIYIVPEQETESETEDQ